MHVRRQVRPNIVALRLIRLHGHDRNVAGQSRAMQFKILGNTSDPTQDVEAV
jgi:hypothetical protein